MAQKLHRCARDGCPNFIADWDPIHRPLYCSSSCKQKAYRARRKLREKKPPKTRPVEHCQNCGKPFWKVRAEHRYCSANCRAAWHYQKLKGMFDDTEGLEDVA